MEGRPGVDAAPEIIGQASQNALMRAVRAPIYQKKNQKRLSASASHRLLS